MIQNIGCDIVEIDRIRKNKNGIASKILTNKEKEIYDGYKEERQIEFLAGRFALKEAIFKAIGNADLLLSKIEILMDKEGKPICTLEEYNLHISIAHEKSYAIAYAICEK